MYCTYNEMFSVLQVEQNFRLYMDHCTIRNNMDHCTIRNNMDPNTIRGGGSLK